MEKALKNCRRMDKTFPTFFTSEKQIFDPFQSKLKDRWNRGETEKYTNLLYSCFNYVNNDLNIKVNLNDFVVKGSTYKALFKGIYKKEALDFLDTFYLSYNIIIRVYICYTKGKQKPKIETLFDDMTHIKLNNETQEIEILFDNIGNNYFLAERAEFFFFKYPYYQ